MKVKFTKFERVAGLFILTALMISFLTFVGAAVKKGWFSPKEQYFTYVSSAEGLSSGTLVQMSGLKVGSVTGVELISQDKVKVSFDIFSEYSAKIGKQSHVMVFRPFLIGDKVLDIQAQSNSREVITPGSEIPSIASTDLMDILSGKKMGAVLASMDQLSHSLKVVGEAFADGERAKDLVLLLDGLKPLVQNLNVMSQEVTRATSIAMKQKHLEKLMANLDVLTTEFIKITPAIATVAPELPQTSLRAVEALNEAVVLLKAMQRSFFLRGHVERVRKEEKKRRPAQAK